MKQRLILTAASPAYEQSLLALLGSLNVNWPDHPPILVHDLGMGAKTLAVLDRANIEVRKVPEFCPHWRKHFTWKIWCCCNAPCETYVWIDAGICVLRPMPEAFLMADALGYFIQPNTLSLDVGVCQPLREHFGLTPRQLPEMLGINAGIHGMNKTKARALLEEAMRLCLHEPYMAAQKPKDLHDQDLFSVLLYKHFSPLVFADRQLYDEDHGGPRAHSGQRVWVHRRGMLSEDMNYFIRHVDRPGQQHIPRTLPPGKEFSPSLLVRIRIRIAQWRGRCPLQPRRIYDGVRD